MRHRVCNPMRRWLPALTLFLAVAPALQARPAGQVLTGRVVGVSDGDTLTLLVGRTTHRIRLHGIDAPESHQDFGSRAKQALSQAVFGKTIRVEVKDRDRYGRLVGVVRAGDRDVNAQLAGAGMAWAYRQYSTDYVPEELKARQAKRGLWSGQHPIPPWEFRRGGGRSSSGGLPARTLRSQKPAAPAPATDTVHITRTGRKYHAAGCRYLSRSDIVVSRSEAERRGLTPCSVCGGG